MINGIGSGRRHMQMCREIMIIMTIHKRNVSFIIVQLFLQSLGSQNPPVARTKNNYFRYGTHILISFRF
ncbi:hypothetical protein D3C78_1522450 [compost metagenome]